MSVRALTCGSHSGSNCVICRNYASDNALLCDGCASKQNQCCVCDTYGANDPGQVCSQHARKCVRCGGYV
jgi:hypothetical protein